MEDIYTDDQGMIKRAIRCGMNPITTAQLVLPTEARQLEIKYDAPDEIPDPADEPNPEA